MKRATNATKKEYNHDVHFNPRPREEGDTNNTATYAHGLNFNPRPREEGDADKRKDKQRNGISIHALVKRATED